MKKTITIIMLLSIVAVLFPTCKKDRVCKCIGNGSSTTTTMKKVTKRVASCNCVDFDQVTPSHVVNGVTIPEQRVSYDCKLED